MLVITRFMSRELLCHVYALHWWLSCFRDLSTTCQYWFRRLLYCVPVQKTDVYSMKNVWLKSQNHESLKGLRLSSCPVSFLQRSSLVNQQLENKIHNWLRGLKFIGCCSYSLYLATSLIYSLYALCVLVPLRLIYVCNALHSLTFCMHIPSSLRAYFLCHIP